jgi:hypothetical protein
MSNRLILQSAYVPAYCVSTFILRQVSAFIHLRHLMYTLTCLFTIALNKLEYEQCQLSLQSFTL